MALYYFHVRNGLGFTRDEEGQELADEDAAMDVALRSVRSLVAAEATEGRIDLRGRIEVTDRQGGPVFALAFEDAVELMTGEPPDV